MSPAQHTGTGAMSPPDTQISRGVNAGSPTPSRANAPEPTSPRGSGAQIAEKQKLSVIPKGHWRNKYELLSAVQWTDGFDEPGIHWGERCWPSREVAQQKADDSMVEMICNDPLLAEVVKYLGPVFFPDP